MKATFSIPKVFLYLFILGFSSGTLYCQNLNIGKVSSKHYFEEIPFKYIKEKILIPVEIEGKTYRFILDTGAPNIISEEIRAIIQPKPLQSINVTDASNKRQSLDVVSVNSLSIGNTQFTNTATLVFDLKASKIFSCLGIDGFIGSNMLRNSILQIDLDEKIIRITNSRKKLNLDKANATKMKLLGAQSNPYIWIELGEDTKSKNHVLIDTGSSSIYDFSKREFELLKSVNTYTVYENSYGAAAISIFGDAPLNKHYRVGIPKLKVNNFVINNHITNTTNDDNSSIGLGILKYGKMTLDYRNKWFYFDNKEPNTYETEIDYGFTLTLLGDKFVIGFVWDKSLKDKLNYGDEIIEIDGIKLDDSSFCDFFIKSSYMNDKNTVTITTKNKEGLINQLKVSKTKPKHQE